MNSYQTKFRTRPVAKTPTGDAYEKGGMRARPYYIPFMVLALLAAGFGLSLLFQEQSPTISAINPQVGNPGEVMVIDGNYFGKDQTAGWVSIANQRVSASSILEWTSQRISLRIPEEAHSGYVMVQTNGGHSRALSFTSQNQIPRISQLVHSSINAILTSCDPVSAYPGDPIIIRGRNFGHASGSLSVMVNGKILSGGDIYKWSNSEIGFWMPLHAGNAEIKLHSDQGDSNSLNIQSQQSTASISATDDAIHYSLELFYNFKDIKRTAQPQWASLTAYMPLPVQSLEQTVSSPRYQGSDMVQETDGQVSFSITNPDPDLRYRLSARWNVARQGIRLRVDSDPELNYDNYLDLQKRYAVPSPLVPSGESAVKTFAQQAVGPETKPLAKARLLYKAVVETLRFDPESGLSFAPEALSDRAANSFGYANLLTGALRSQGIPARIIEGVLAWDGPARQHYWTEFFIPTVGWVQADAALPDMLKVAAAQPELSQLSKQVVPSAIDPQSWYFGNIDSHHIALIRGEGLTSLTRLDANIQKLFQHLVLMQVHGESGGYIESFGLFIDSPEVHRIY